MVARDLSVGGARNSSINVNKAARATWVTFDSWPVQPPGAVVDVCSVCGSWGLLDQQDIQVLALVVINEGFHSRSRFHGIQL